MPELTTAYLYKAAKDHECSGCAHQIPIGETYVHAQIIEHFIRRPVISKRFHQTCYYLWRDRIPAFKNKEPRKRSYKERGLATHGG